MSRAFAPAAAWIRNRRDRYYPRGECLGPADRDILAPFHDTAVLDLVRVCRVPLHFGRVAGITYSDTILIDSQLPASGPPWQRLVFHELVHVVQYAVLGIDEFIHRYLRDWAAGGCRYRLIPLEEDAYAIEARFTADPRRPFGVREEVERRLRGW
jgi:hypothetical protein